ncbi:sigma factor-like helix-turn-helix DNA-binding protein [Sporosarcina sp.]|uniref:sigma factor-like helix-turn-helix DNA-binding protein n=1 Tax=Sporosarcina sp. TaxID=49982 RepID=UPI002616E553|nr:sigma factor-like helix-turn-helix DNA-binding protein [Sporosarcina sp.]
MRDWANDMIEEYTMGQLELENRAKALDRNSRSNMDDLTQINSMMESMAFSIDWMATGRQPGTYRGAEKRAVYQIQYIDSMETIPDIAEQLEEDHKHLFISKEARLILADIFASMSHRERQCYVLHERQGMSMGRIADEAGLKKRTVQQYIERARQKVSERVEKNVS